MGNSKRIVVCKIITFLSIFNLGSVYGQGWTAPERPRAPTTQKPNNDQDQWGGKGTGGQPNREHEHTSDNYGNGQFGQSYENPRDPNGFYQEGHIERYGYPKGCELERNPRNTCNYYVEIERVQGNELHFELTGRIREDKSTGKKWGYVALGLSKDKLMGDDDIVECVKLEDDRTDYYQSWSDGRSRPIRLKDTVIRMDESYPQYDPDLDLLTCRFSRQIITSYEVSPSSSRGNRPVEIDLLRGKYYVFLAVGGLQVNAGALILKYHGPRPVEQGTAYVSSDLLGRQKYDFSSHSSEGDHGWNTGKGNGGQKEVGNCVQAVFGAILVRLFMLYN